MIRRSILTASALALALAATPLAAQEGDSAASDAAAAQFGADDFAETMANVFPKAAPLTPEQEAGLPLAREVVAQIFPEGTYARMMDGTMQPMMDGIMNSFTDLPINQILKLTGLYGEDFSQLGEGTIKEVMGIMDPAFDERSKKLGDATLALVSDVMTQIEPAYRDGLARAYAVRFSPAELAELKRYFATPVGAKYASESMLIYADPQVMSAMNELVPAVMTLMPRMLERIEEVNAGLAEPRRYSQLTAEEQARLAQLLGVSPQTLRESEPQEWEEGEGGSYDGQGHSGEGTPGEAGEAAPAAQADEVAAPAA